MIKQANMNLNPYEPSEGTDSANRTEARSPIGRLLIFLRDFGLALIIMYTALNLRSLLGVGMPRRYASYTVEFEAPFSIWNWVSLSTVSLGLMALAIAITTSIARVVFEGQKGRRIT